MSEASSAEDKSAYTRLHISPLTPALLPSIVTASLRSIARNISYHTLETFPERPYGYVELPAQEADTLKKKLHGTILKGSKVRVEKARQKESPETPVDMEEHDGQPELEGKKSRRKEKKLSTEDKSRTKKRGEETVPAVDIGDRQVKRGWTVPGASASASGSKENRRERKSREKEKKKGEAETEISDRRKSREFKKMAAKSKFTTGPECLFKTVLPANVATNTAPLEEDSKSAKKKRKRGSGREAVVHEFQQTTKHATFLKDTSAKENAQLAHEYLEGKGWVDANGDIVESEVLSKRRKRAKESVDAVPVASQPAEEPSETSSGSSDGEPAAASPATSNPVGAEQNQLRAELASKADAAATNQAIAAASSSKGAKVAQEVQVNTKVTPRKGLTITIESPSQRVPGSGPSTGLSLSIPDADTKSVHPLEALYKRPKDGNAGDTSTGLEPNSFNFFGTDGDGAKDETMQPPMTPFTEKDFQWRSSRSAAPTPDTAFANKKFEWPRVSRDNTQELEKHEEEADETDEEGATGLNPVINEKVTENTAEKEEEQSEFSKWFYEHRGETTRAWKKRRRTVAKEKRQRENRKRSDK